MNVDLVPGKFIFRLIKKTIKCDIGLGNSIHLVPRIILFKNEKLVVLELHNISFRPTMIRHIALCLNDETKSSTSLYNINILIKTGAIATKNLLPIKSFEKNYKSSQRYKFLLIFDNKNLFYYYDFEKIYFRLGFSKSFRNKKSLWQRIRNYLCARKLRDQFFEDLKVYDINS